ncbi:MAG TPA: hypothetical protein VGH64_08220 [Puia sp.]
MKFTYEYQGISYNATAEWSTSFMTNVFRIRNLTQIFDIYPNRSGIRIRWELYSGGELPEDFLQAVGEGLEKAGIY